MESRSPTKCSELTEWHSTYSLSLRNTRSQTSQGAGRRWKSWKNVSLSFTSWPESDDSLFSIGGRNTLMCMRETWSHVCREEMKITTQNSPFSHCWRLTLPVNKRNKQASHVSMFPMRERSTVTCLQAGDEKHSIMQKLAASPLIEGSMLPVGKRNMVPGWSWESRLSISDGGEKLSPACLQAGDVSHSTMVKLGSTWPVREKKHGPMSASKTWKSRLNDSSAWEAWSHFCGQEIKITAQRKN